MTAASWRPTREPPATGWPGPSPPPGSARPTCRPHPSPGWAAACATVARLAAPLRPVLAVVDGPIDSATTPPSSDAASGARGRHRCGGLDARRPGAGRRRASGATGHPRQPAAGCRCCGPIRASWTRWWPWPARCAPGHPLRSRKTDPGPDGRRAIAFRIAFRRARTTRSSRCTLREMARAAHHAAPEQRGVVGSS